MDLKRILTTLARIARGELGEAAASGSGPEAAPVSESVSGSVSVSASDSVSVSVSVSASVSASDSVSVPASVSVSVPDSDSASAPVSDTVSASEDEASPALSGAPPVVTRTLAALLESQGHRARALRVVEALLARSPDDPALLAHASRLRGDAPAEVLEHAPDSLFSIPLSPTTLHVSWDVTQAGLRRAGRVLDAPGTLRLRVLQVSALATTRLLDEAVDARGQRVLEALMPDATLVAVIGLAFEERFQSIAHAPAVTLPTDAPTDVLAFEYAPLPEVLDPRIASDGSGLLASPVSADHGRRAAPVSALRAQALRGSAADVLRAGLVGAPASFEVATTFEGSSELALADALARR